jgi:hypothetical protein
MSGHDGEDSTGQPDSDEKTAALSLADMGLEDDEGEATAAIGLEELGLNFDAPVVAAAAPAQDAEEEVEDKTAAFSLEDMGIVDEAPPAEVAPEIEDAEEEVEDKTAAFSLEDMGIVDEAPPVAASDDAPQDERTAALSLEDMGLEEAPTKGEEERTAALSLDDMGIGALDDDEEEETVAMTPVKAAPPAAESGSGDDERTAAMSLNDMGIDGADAGDERTAAMSLDDMGIEAGPPPPELEVRSGNDRGESFVVKGASLTVGRGLDCDIVLNDASVSRKHFRLDETASGYRMVDLGSGNGTKVNGIRLSEFDLAHGTVLEAGTTTMAWKQLDKLAAPAEFKEGWDDNAESTRVSDLAAISVLPEWKEQVQHEDQAKVVAAQRGPLKMIVMLLSIMIALMLGFMGLDKALNMGIVFDDGTAAEADLAAAGTKREAIELMNAGREAFSEREWSKARKKFRDALELDDTVREGKRYLRKTKDEAAAFKALRRGRAALDDAQYAEAVVELGTIDDTSLYYSEDGEGGEGALDLLAQAIDSLVEAKLLESQRLDDSGDNAGALAAIEEALKIAPNDASALALKAELSEEADSEAAAPSTASSRKSSPARPTTARRSGGKRASEAKRASRTRVEAKRTAESTSRSSKTTETAAESTSKKSKKSKKRKKSAGMVVALSSYATGDFAEAISELTSLSKRGSRKSKAKAKRLAAAIEKFQTIYAPAMAAAKSFRSPTKTVKALRAARKLDASISGAYSKRLRKELARQLAFQANQAWSTKKFGKAGRHARQALALDPELTQAKKIYSEVQAQAQGWFDQAKAAASSNPDKAMQLLSRVVSIFPRGDHRYKEAYKLLNQLAAEEED